MKRLFAIFVALVCVNGMVFSQKKTVTQVKTVVIDAGHGGAKPGAVGKKSQEKDLTLSMALKLGQLIKDNYSDVTVVYTRTSDVDITLANRARVANKAKADLFISIHCNSCPSSVPTGVETYVMGLSKTKANMEVAKKENADILLEDNYKDNSDYQGFDPNSPESYVMFSMFQNAYIDKSLDFADLMQKEYRRAINTVDRGVKQAEFFVLYQTSMPSVLTEVGFISNAEEEQYMMSDEGQATIVSSIFKAFVAYKSASEGVKVPTNLVYTGLKGYKEKKQKSADSQVPDLSADKKSKEGRQEKTYAELNASSQKNSDNEVTLPSTMIPSTAATGVEPPLPMEEPKPDSSVVSEPISKPATVALTKEETEEPLAKGLRRKNDPKPAVAVESPAAPVSAKPAAPVLEKPAKTESKPSAPLTVTESPVVEKPAVASPENPANESVVYKVQFMTCDRVLKAGAREFRGITDYEYYRQRNIYCYTIGSFAKLSDAVAMQKNVREKGFSDAFVVAFYAGERITMQQAKELSNK